MKEPAAPAGVPNAYVMQPFDVKLSYLGKPWCTVPLEVGHNEIGDAEFVEWHAPAARVAALFEVVGFPAPGKAPLMVLEYQVAQKLHALTAPGDRVRDMVDLQLIDVHAGFDLKKARSICIRLFAYRRMQAWPPMVVEAPGWRVLYSLQAAELPVLQEVAEAIAWTNDLIARIDDAR